MIEETKNFECIFHSDEAISEEYKKKISEAFAVTLKNLGLGNDRDNISVDINFVPSEDIKELNRMSRNVDRVTDVLSFPMFSDLEEVESFPTEVPIHLGDVFICIDKINQQASDYGNTVEKELIYLTIHSFLHLLGYDHMEARDDKKMREKEEEILNLLQL